MKKIKIADFWIGPQEKLAIMAGPCVIESEKHALMSAATLQEIFARHEINLIYKSSFDKANRSALNSYRGPGLKEGLKILKKIKETFHLPIVTDIHYPEQAGPVSEVADILQIPAFLCRQTDLIVAAAETKRAVNLKKGQFMAPLDMRSAVEKIRLSGNEQIILTDRGTFFGYNNLVSDMRSIALMQSLGCPVCFDATHSVQLPGTGLRMEDGQEPDENLQTQKKAPPVQKLLQVSGGQREFIPLLAKAAIAAGANLLFLEAHDNPRKAKSDAASQIDFKELETFLIQIEKLYKLMQSF
jgi:2-dehydro-3-deoxyphosphooctonate aldolase (KDO 8-P synthase)